MASTAATKTDDNNDEMMITVRVVGLGHKLTLSLSPSSSQTLLDDLKEQIAKETSIPPPYQRLICHGKNLEDDNDKLQNKDLHRTKIMLLHNASYNQDKDALEQIQNLQEEIDKLRSDDNDVDEIVKHELATQICCQLDSIDIHGSPTLRQLRKAALQSAENI